MTKIEIIKLISRSEEAEDTRSHSLTVREKIVATARTWIGTPYRLTGRDRLGIDCCNFPAAVYRELGLFDQFLPAYRRIDEPELLGIIAQLGLKRIAPARALAGDMLIFRAYAWKCHPAVVSDRGVIHCPAAPVVEQRISAVGGSVMAAYRAPRFTD